MPPSRMVSLNSDIFKCCHKVTTLGWSNDAEAKKLLQRAADQVKPIMAKRQWAVPVVSEFYPPVPNLLGLNHNHGEKIDIRLRSPRNQNSFLSYHSILGTLLHELVHIELGPHNAAFYKLLDEIKRECEQLMASDNTGNSTFTGQGHKVSTVGRNVHRGLAAEHAAKAAQKRVKIGAIMSRGGGRLGGDKDIFRLCDPREMALAAAQRRLQDDIWCASAREGPNDNDEVIEIHPQKDIIVIHDDDDEAENNPKPAASASKPQIKRPVGVTAAQLARQRRMRRGTAQRVPVRQNPAALAALHRAANKRH